VKQLRHLLWIGLFGLLATCKDSTGPGQVSPPPGKDPGPVDVSISKNGLSDDGAIILRITGPGLDTIPTSAITGLEATSYLSLDDTTLTIVAVGEHLPAQATLELDVPDRNQLSHYRLTVLDVARNDFSEGSAADYSVTIARKP